MRKRERRIPVQEALVDAFAPLEGAELPGGCDECGAHQTVEPIEAGAWRITVHHDEGCPVLEAKAGGR